MFWQVRKSRFVYVHILNRRKIILSYFGIYTIFYTFLILTVSSCFTCTNLHKRPAFPFRKSSADFILQSSLENYNKDPENELKYNTQKNTNTFSSRNNHWIILVDDEESIRMALGEFLYSSGYSVTACADPEALFHILSSAMKEPDVIVSDIRMPNSSIDGLQLLSLLKGNDPDSGEYYRWRDIPVVLLTAKSLTPDRIAGYRLGAQAYLSKPFAPEELLSVIDNLIKRRLEQSNSNIDTKALQDIGGDLKEIKSLLKSSQDQTIVDVDYGSKEQDTPGTKAQLTPTEIDVLMLLCDGFSNGEIAAKRGKSTIGIGKVISRLYLKTETKTRTELVRWAMKNGHLK